MASGGSSGPHGGGIVTRNVDVTYAVTHNVYDMTPVAAAALEARAKADRDIADATFAVPAREETKRAQEETKRTGGILATVVILVGVAVLSPAATGVATVGVLVVGGAWGARELVREWKKKPKEAEGQKP